MKELLIGVDELAREEWARANKEHGEYFHSDEEGYFVIEEEVDEAMEELSDAYCELNGLKYAIRDDHKQGAAQIVVKMRKYAACAAAEAIQVTAMCDKFIASQEVREK